MIQANCRNNFTAEDFSFITEVLSDSPGNKVALAELLTDAEMRDQILDHEILFETLRARRGFTRFSPHLYFYVLTRQSLLSHQINDRELADYLASMLAEFSSTNRAFSPSGEYTRQYHYLTDILSDVMDASSWEAFLLRSHLGNYSLFMTGIFPDYINRRATYGRQAPGFDYYEKMGSSSYLWASQNQFAVKYRLVEILATLADQFRQVRIALNKLSDEYISLDDQPDDMDTILRRIFSGSGDARN